MQQATNGLVDCTGEGNIPQVQASRLGMATGGAGVDVMTGGDGSSIGKDNANDDHGSSCSDDYSSGGRTAASNMVALWAVVTAAQAVQVASAGAAGEAYVDKQDDSEPMDVVPND